MTMTNTSKVTGKDLLQDVKGMVEKLCQETDAVKRSAEFQNWIRFCSGFHKYSFTNTLLIAMQCPHASMVAGFRAWQKKNRYVMKGEKAIRILSPRWYKTGIIDQATGEEIEEIYFAPVSVFDVSQTDGEEVPELNYTLEGNSLQEQHDKMVELYKENSIMLSFKPLNGPKGLSAGGWVEIEETLDINEKFSVMVHEFAHEKLHQGNPDRPDERKIREYQAEITSSIVLSLFGIDTSASATYLAAWRAEAKDIQEAFTAALPVASKIIRFLERTEEQTEDISAVA